MDKGRITRIFFQKIPCNRLCVIYYFDNEKIEKTIDLNKLDRDYELNPIRIIKNGGRYKPDKPSKNDLEYLYIELFLPKEIISKIINCQPHNISKWICDYGIKRNRKYIIELSKQTKLKKYGNENYNNIEKMKQTNLERYGVEWTTIVPDVIEKIKNTNLERYGVVSTTCVPEIKRKQELSCLKHYGVINPSFSPEIIDKIYNIRKNNKSWNISKDEKIIIELLLEKYPNTKTQYKSELYPWKCDFYIPEIDLYIEYQGLWTHGVKSFNYNGTHYNCHCPYDPNNLIHQEVIKQWKNKNSNFYNSAIETWTIKDVLKRETAKKNNLNWIEFFTIKDFNDWYEQLNTLEK